MNSIGNEGSSSKGDNNGIKSSGPKTQSIYITFASVSNLEIIMSGFVIIFISMLKTELPSPVKGAL